MSKTIANQRQHDDFSPETQRLANYILLVGAIPRTVVPLPVCQALKLGLLCKVGFNLSTSLELVNKMAL
jgi:hypothetical protein